MPASCGLLILREAGRSAPAGGDLGGGGASGGDAMESPAGYNARGVACSFCGGLLGGCCRLDGRLCIASADCLGRAPRRLTGRSESVSDIGVNTGRRVSSCMLPGRSISKKLDKPVPILLGAFPWTDRLTGSPEAREA